MHSSANKKLTKSLHNLSQAIRSHVVTRKIIIARGPLLLTDPHFLNLGLLGLEFCNFRGVSLHCWLSLIPKRGYSSNRGLGLALTYPLGVSLQLIIVNGLLLDLLYIPCLKTI